MFNNFKTYNYSLSNVTPDGLGRHEGAFLSGDIINGFDTVIGTGLQVIINPGNALIRIGTGGTLSARLVSLTAAFTGTLATADASNPRIDAIVMYVDTSVTLPGGTPTSANSDGPGVTKVAYVSGTPNASPAAPSTAAIQTAIGSASYPYTILANWRVDAGASALSQSKCTDTRVFSAPTNPRALGASSYIDSGGVASFTASTLNGAITAGQAFINVGGVLVPQSFNSLSFTMAASKDRYYYVTLGNATIQAATDVSNGAAIPTLPANSAWVTKVVSGASSITTVNNAPNGNVPIAFGAYQTGSQSIAVTTFTKVQFQVEEFDDGANFDNTTNHRFTVPVGGDGNYLFSAGAVLTGTVDTNRMFVTLYKNGAEFKRGARVHASTSDDLSSVVVSTMKLAVNDYVEVYIWQNSGGAKSTGAVQHLTYFSGSRVR